MKTFILINPVEFSTKVQSNIQLINKDLKFCFFKKKQNKRRTHFLHLKKFCQVMFKKELDVMMVSEVHIPKIQTKIRHTSLIKMLSIDKNQVKYMFFLGRHYKLKMQTISTRNNITKNKNGHKATVKVTETKNLSSKTSMLFGINQLNYRDTNSTTVSTC